MRTLKHPAKCTCPGITQAPFWASLGKAGSAQAFYCFHAAAAAGAASTQLRAVTGKGNKLQHKRQGFCTAVGLCLMWCWAWCLRLGRVASCAPGSLPGTSYREQYQSLDMNKDVRLKRHFVKETQGLVMTFAIGPGRRSHGLRTWILRVLCVA